MAKATNITDPLQAITAEDIMERYIDYVLHHDEQPKSVYVFSKSLGLSEAEFYDYFASFEAIENHILSALASTTIEKARAQEIWEKYSSREKVLSFFFSYVELLKSKRSFVIFSLKKKLKQLSTPSSLTETKLVYGQFIENILADGLASGELEDRKFISKHYKDALWVQFLFILKFWIEDKSAEFEKTDEVIEKGINLTFDLFQRSALDSLLDYGKFLAQNSRIKEKMGL